MIAENGVLIMIAAVVLFIGCTYAVILLNDLRRRKSGAWVPREELIEAAAEAFPARVIPITAALPKLTEHPVFGQWEDDLRSVDRLVMRDGITACPHKTQAAQDLVRAVIRPTRNLWRGIVRTLYEDVSKLEDHLGDEQSFRHFVRGEYAKLMEVTNRQLVSLGLPAEVITRYSLYIDLSDSIATAMLERACDHPLGLNYFRLSAVLDTQLARALSLRKTLIDIVRDSDCSGYERDESATTPSTLESFPAQAQPDLGAALVSANFDYRPKFRS